MHIACVAGVERGRRKRIQVWLQSARECQVPSMESIALPDCACILLLPSLASCMPAKHATVHIAIYLHVLLHSVQNMHLVELVLHVSSLKGIGSLLFCSGHTPQENISSLGKGPPLIRDELIFNLFKRNLNRFVMRLKSWSSQEKCLDSEPNSSSQDHWKWKLLVKFWCGIVCLQHLEIDVEGKVSLHQLTNLLESVVEEQSDGKSNNVRKRTAFYYAKWHKSMHNVISCESHLRMSNKVTPPPPPLLEPMPSGAM